MTDLPAPPPPRDPDDVASDVVDGLLPPDEAAAAQRDPAVAQRVHRILEARDALRSTPPFDADAAERAIAAAVEVFDPTGPSAPATDQDRATSPLPPPLRSIDSTVAGPVTSSPTSGHGRRPVGPWLAAAAALLVALATVGLLARNGRDDSEDTAARSTEAETSSEPDQTGEESTAEGGGAGAPAADEAPQGGDDAGSASETDARTQADALVHQLGEVRDADELAARVTSSVDGGRDRPTQPTDAGGLAEEGAESPGGAQSCAGLTTGGDPSRGVSVFVADAVLDGNPVRVHVYRSGDHQQLVATDHACTTVVDTPLD
jgi:hypothetical protein